jgi:hypothetical protein
MTHRLQLKVTNNFRGRESDVALSPADSGTDSSSNPVDIQDSPLHSPVLSFHVEPHASSTRIPFPVEFFHSSQYVSTTISPSSPPPHCSTNSHYTFHYPAFSFHWWKLVRGSPRTILTFVSRKSREI